MLAPNELAAARGVAYAVQRVVLLCQLTVLYHYSAHNNVRFTGGFKYVCAATRTPRASGSDWSPILESFYAGRQKMLLSGKKLVAEAIIKQPDLISGVAHTPC